MKRKTLTLAISVFALLAIISVGFASWVITRPVTDVVADGTITVDDVTDLNVTISYKWVQDATGNTELETANPIVFGNDAAATSADWLYNTKIGTENLVAYLKVTVTVDDASAMAGKKIIATFNAVNASKEVSTTYAEAISENYITGPYNGSTLSGEFTASDFDDSKKTATKVITIQFGWGQEFGKVNPIKHWPTYSDENATAATNALNALKNKLTGVSYNVTLSQTNA